MQRERVLRVMWCVVVLIILLDLVIILLGY